MTSTYRIYFRDTGGTYYVVGGRNAKEAVRTAKAVARKFAGLRRPKVTRIQRLARPESS
jgi:hypothetical protein